MNITSSHMRNFMNLNQKLIDDYSRLNFLEEHLKDSSTTKKYCDDERKVLLQIQHLMYKALKEQYPCHGLQLTSEMCEYYNFEIKVTPK